MKKKKEKIKEKLIKNKKAIGILHISHTPCSKLYIYIYIYIYIYLYNCFSISNDPTCPIGRAYIQTVMDERITLCNYTTQSFMFCTFVRYTFLFYLKKQGQNCY